MNKLGFGAYVWQMNDGTWRIDQKTNARLYGAVRFPWDTGVWKVRADADQHLRLIEAQLQSHTKPLIEVLDFIAGHARLAVTNYGPDKEASIQNRNASFEQIERRARRAIAEIVGTP